MTYGGVETGVIIGGVDSVKIVEVNGMEIWGSEIPTEIFGGRGGIEEIGIVEVMGEDGGVTGEGGGVVVRFRKVSRKML